jgi:ribonuclease-3 family protein
MKNPELYSGRALAFLGDAVWSLIVRDYLLEQGEGKGKTLQRRSISYVSAKAQAGFYEKLHAEHFLSDEEEGWFHRGRNGNTGTLPKNTSSHTYRMSTGFEAVLGALYLKEDYDRIRKIWDRVRTMQEE